MASVRNSVFKLLRNFSQKRTPRVQFRYGVRESQLAHVPTRSRNSPQAILEAARPGTLYDFEIPDRLKRSDLADAEIESINSGGASKIF